jgi:hypothetical protein
MRAVILAFVRGIGSAAMSAQAAPAKAVAVVLIASAVAGAVIVALVVAGVGSGAIVIALGVVVAAGMYGNGDDSNEAGQGRERDVRSSLATDDPERRLSLCEADQARNDFAVILDELAFLKEQVARLPTRAEVR